MILSTDIDVLLRKVKGPLGEDDFIEPLSILLSEYQKAPELNTLGRIALQQSIISQLRHRSKLYQFISTKTLPEISHPVFISGLPRSGTTFLFDLLHCDNNFRGPLTWEIFQMMPIANNWPRKIIKINKTNLKLGLIKTLMPDLMKMHPMKANLPEECQQIMSIDFKSIAWSYMVNVPEYESFLQSCNYDSAMLWHSRFLQALETVHKPKHWLLKDPCHIQHIKEILNIYPSAKFIFLHRDPIDAIPSVSSLTNHLRTPFTNNINKNIVGKNAISFWRNAIDCFLVDRKIIPKGQCVDIQFKEFIANPLEQTLLAYKQIGLELDYINQENIKTYIAQQSSSKTNKHRYTLKEFGLCKNLIRESFNEYYDQFDL